MRSSWGAADILVLIAVVCFALAVIGVDVRVNLVALGLAFGFAAFLVRSRGLRAP